MTHESPFYRFLDLLTRNLSALIIIGNGFDILFAVRVNMLLQEQKPRHKEISE